MHRKRNQAFKNPIFHSNDLVNWRQLGYVLDRPAGSLSLGLRPETLSGTRNPSFLARRQQHIYGSASTLIDFKPGRPDEFAGLVAFRNEEHNYVIGKTLYNSGQAVIQLPLRPVRPKRELKW